MWEKRGHASLCKLTVNVTFAVNGNRRIEEIAPETQRKVFAERDVVELIPFFVKHSGGLDSLAKLLIRSNKRM